jgi:hypothetical protein
MFTLPVPDAVQKARPPVYPANVMIPPVPSSSDVLAAKIPV